MRIVSQVFIDAFFMLIFVVNLYEPCIILLQ
jgi:hypothetical protein